MAIIKRSPVPVASGIVFQGQNPPYRDLSDIYRKVAEWRINTNPLDIETLIKKHGIKVLKEEMDDLSGYIEKRSSGWVIGINKYQSPRRQRFTLAHEFAHFLFDNPATRHSDHIMLRSNEINDEERRANEFAAELLMPEQFFREKVESGVRDLAELAEEFDVSIAAIRYRAFKLRYIKGY